MFDRPRNDLALADFELKLEIPRKNSKTFLPETVRL